MSGTKTAVLSAALVATLGAAIWSFALARSAAEDAALERGRYIARIAGCNDCHTPGYPESAGAVPESQWLTGTRVGWRGPWGTTYPANLRLYMQRVTEDEWVKLARNTQMRPPMPWFALRDMHEEDLRAFHRFMRQLGPAGEAVPAYVPPGEKPKGPVIAFPGH